MTKRTPLVESMTAEVQRFQGEILGYPIPTFPRMLDERTRDFKAYHLEEELTEFWEAKTIEDQADALLDLVYVSLGAVIQMGIVPGGPFGEIHFKNMQKERGELSKRPGAQGFDAVKPEGWTPPNLLPYLTLSKKDIDRCFARDTARDLKLLIVGHGRHGKDTVSELLRDVYGMSFTSSSMFCAEHVLLEAFATNQALPTYQTAEACFNDRHNHRAFWYDSICRYNAEDQTCLAREITARYSIYCGMRAKEELLACKEAGVFDAIIWVDASKRVPPESGDSCTVTSDMADFVLDNNGSISELVVGLEKLMQGLCMAKLGS